LVWSNPRPAEEEIRGYYSRQYRLDYKGRSTPSLRHVARSGRGALIRYRGLRPLLPPHDAILDVGAGGGELVYVLRQLGYDARGIEPDEQYARYARETLRVPVETGFVQDVSFPSGSLGAVTMYHSLEHVEDPSGVLSRLRRWLRPDGWLVVEVPNVEAICLAPHHRFHFAHFFSFNRLTLEALGRKTGFEPVRTAASEDGGNLTSVFRSAALEQEIPALAGNCARIAGVIRDHRPLSHYLSAAPYIGPFGRLRAYVADRAAARGRADARQVLDALVTGHRSCEAHE
jgi:2-polyprenyl-3-methyl-5-hydroxy-6-metoxy-1,4-benzoquinol methylase